MSVYLPEDEIIKIYLHGDNSVGTTSFIQRYKDNTFSLDPQRDFSLIKLCAIKHIFNKNIKITIWNIANMLIPRILIDFNVLILMYDITNAESFEFIQYQYNLIQTLIKEKCIVYFIGNKSDMRNEREITKKEAINFCEENEIHYYECSAKTGENVEEIMFILLRDVLSIIENKREKIKQKNFVRCISNCICI